MTKSKIYLSPSDAAFVAKHLPSCELRERLEAFVENYPFDLNERIWRFLQANELSIAWIPKIQELGKYPGGFALVKQISEAGGLKKVRPNYAHYVLAKLTS